MKETIQQRLHERLHAVFNNDRKKMFPFLKMATGKAVRSTKVVLEMDDAETRQLLALLNFFVKELSDADQYGEVKGTMHHHFLWGASREELRILCLMRHGKSSGTISRLLKVSLDWVNKIQYEMLAKGACLGKFSHIEEMVASYVQDGEMRNALAVSYDDNLDIFAAKLSYRKKHFSVLQGQHLAAYYAREMLAKTLFGSDFRPAELAI